MNVINETLFVIWFFLPAGIANMAPVFAAKAGVLKSLDKPVDLGKSYKGIRIFGDHKTIRGFVTGIIAAIVFVWLQKLILANSPVVLRLDYANISPLLLGTLMGLGALVGDAIKSFFKRRVGVKPGKSWVPWDQVDFVIGASVLTYFYIPLPLYQYVLVVVVFFLLHMASKYIGYLTGLNKDPI
ncbi:CDP-archaeol synthase [Patescibacteria group bacterium]